MKIALFDPYLPKFTQDIIDSFRAQGHEVKTDRYYDPKLVEWADIVWFDTCDNNLKSAMYPDKSDPTQEGWDLHEMDLTRKKIIVRIIDIEVWVGHNMNVDWSLITDIVYIAPHIMELVKNSPNWKPEYDAKCHFIPCGVNLEKFTFKERQAGFNIGVVSEIWESKGADLFLQVALKLRQIDERYNIQWVGKMQCYQWDWYYIQDFIKRHDLKIEFIEHVESIDEFLEDKNYLLHCSLKEGFSYATAEAMAKGIKPVTHSFYGSEHLWPGLTWDSIDEAVIDITEDFYDSNDYRQYLIEKGYTVDGMMERITEVLK
jgi:glycosyltransferase involved in cell wall biosynthesis